MLSDFNFTCISDCHIIHSSPEIIHINGTFQAEGEGLYINILGIETHSIKALTSNGDLHFHYANLTKPDMENEVNSREGDVLLQTSHDLEVQFKQDSNAVCLSAPSVVVNGEEEFECEGEEVRLNRMEESETEEPFQMNQSVVKRYTHSLTLFSSLEQANSEQEQLTAEPEDESESNPEAESESDNESNEEEEEDEESLEQIGGKKYCKGAYKLYSISSKERIQKEKDSVSITTMPIINTKAYNGNVFVNVIEKQGAPVSQEQFQLFRGNDYAEGLGFDNNMQEILSRDISMLNDTSKTDSILTLKIGNIRGRASSALRFIVATNPAILIAKPWFLLILLFLLTNS